MRVIGLVGGTGTGKSAIARHLVACGAEHIDADAVGHDVLDEPAVRDRIVAAFGGEVEQGGRIDRQRLGPMVFADPALLKRLNSLIHPRIVEVCAARVEACRRRGVSLVVVDAALLLEVAMPFAFDLMIALQASKEERVRRLLADGLARAQIDARLRNQAHLEDAFDRADVVLDTTRSRAEVFADVDEIIKTKSND